MATYKGTNVLDKIRIGFLEYASESGADNMEIDLGNELSAKYDSESDKMSVFFRETKIMVVDGRRDIVFSDLGEKESFDLIQAIYKSLVNKKQIVKAKKADGKFAVYVRKLISEG